MNSFRRPVLSSAIFCHCVPATLPGLRKLSPLVGHTAGGEEAAGRVLFSPKPREYSGHLSDPMVRTSNRTYPILETFVFFITKRRFGGVGAPEGRENVPADFIQSFIQKLCFCHGPNVGLDLSYPNLDVVLRSGQHKRRAVH